VAHRGGHALHTEFAAMVLQERDAWTLVEVPSDSVTAYVPIAQPLREGAHAIN
jgi:UDP-3-O-acyl-N-acetylglucosamine deacetylase